MDSEEDMGKKDEMGNRSVNEMESEWLIQVGLKKSMLPGIKISPSPS
jgi:hypothetical protein